MARLDYGPALELLKDAKTIAICAHVNPDGDALGSVLGCTLGLRSRGYDVTPLLATREKPQVYDFLDGFEDLTPACEYSAKPDVFIALDVPSMSRLADGAHVLKRARTSFVIDHHPSEAAFTDLQFVDTQVAAVGMLVWDFLEQLGVERTSQIANCCYTALVTDTGRFQFQNADECAFTAAAEMTRAGAEPSMVSSMVYQRKSYEALQLNARVMQRMERVCGGRAVISWVTDRDFKEIGARRDDGESLIDIVRQLGGIDVAVMLREQGGAVRGSIRSKTDMDVAAIAAKLDGGGHRAAAGFTVKDKLPVAKRAVLDLLREAFIADSETPAADGDARGAGDSAPCHPERRPEAAVEGSPAADGDAS